MRLKAIFKVAAAAMTAAVIVRARSISPVDQVAAISEAAALPRSPFDSVDASMRSRPGEAAHEDDVLQARMNPPKLLDLMNTLEDVRGVGVTYGTELHQPPAEGSTLNAPPDLDLQLSTPGKASAAHTQQSSSARRPAASLLWSADVLQLQPNAWNPRASFHQAGAAQLALQPSKHFAWEVRKVGKLPLPMHGTQTPSPRDVPPLGTSRHGKVRVVEVPRTKASQVETPPPRMRRYQGLPPLALGEPIANRPLTLMRDPITDPQASIARPPRGRKRKPILEHENPEAVVTRRDYQRLHSTFRRQLEKAGTLTEELRDMKKKVADARRRYYDVPENREKKNETDRKSERNRVARARASGEKSVIPRDAGTKPDSGSVSGSSTQ